MKSLSKDFQYNVVKSGTNITVYHSDSYKNMKGIKIYDVTEQEIFNELRRIDSKYSLKVGVSSKLDPAGEYAEAQKVYDTALKFSPKTLGIVMIADLAAMLTVLILLAINILKMKDSLNRFDIYQTTVKHRLYDIIHIMNMYCTFIMCLNYICRNNHSSCYVF